MHKTFSKIEGTNGEKQHISLNMFDYLGIFNNKIKSA